MRILKGLLVAVLLCIPAFAQADAPAWRGIAVSQAPEAGLGVCFDTDAAAGLACAQDACMAESGLGPEDCGQNLWCSPHAFTADVFLQHAEGPHWHEFLCGAGSREELDRLVAARCDADYLIECEPVRIWDHDGNELLGLVE